MEEIDVVVVCDIGGDDNEASDGLALRRSLEALLVDCDGPAELSLRLSWGMRDVCMGRKRAYNVHTRRDDPAILLAFIRPKGSSRPYTLVGANQGRAS